MDYLVAGSGERIYEGSIVMLSRLTGVKWRVCNGFYTYRCNQCMGWYFSSIPAQTIIPVNDEDLMTLKVINDGGCPCQHSCPPEPEPGPDHRLPKPQPVIYSPEEASRYLDKTFITVNSISERDMLQKRSLIPDGKLVRVNHVYELLESDTENEEDNRIDIGPKYYRYSVECQEFIEIKIENEVSKEDFSELQACLEWKYL